MKPHIAALTPSRVKVEARGLFGRQTARWTIANFQ
jgi:hypothetical protein